MKEVEHRCLRGGLPGPQPPFPAPSRAGRPSCMACLGALLAGPGQQFRKALQAAAGVGPPPRARSWPVLSYAARKHRARPAPLPYKASVVPHCLGDARIQTPLPNFPGLPEQASAFTAASWPQASSCSINPRPLAAVTKHLELSGPRP